MELNSLELWLYLQIALEALLLVLMGVLFHNLKKLSKGPNIPDETKTAWDNFFKESEKLSLTFTENLRQKKELSLGLLLKLERKINELNALLDHAEKTLEVNRIKRDFPMETDKANPAAPENRELVIRLAQRGQSVEEIARQARLHRGEVELILDLEKQFN
ncbi:MAG: hypothetical protein V1816_03635 [Pseudomonadota bacterium]